MGQKLAMYVCPNGSQSAQVGLTLDQDKSAMFEGAIKNSTFAGGKVMVSDGISLVESAVGTTKLGYLANVTSDIQSQINSVSSSLSTEVSRAQAAEALLLPLAGGTTTGLVTMTGGVYVNGAMSVKASQVSSNKTLSAISGPYQGVTNLSGGSLTFTLPAPANGRMFIIKDQTGQASQSTYIQINPYGSETIDGGSSYKIAAPYESATVVCDGTNWYVA
jgi:hypothetical protein